MKPPTTIPVAGVAMEVPVVAAIIARSVCRRPVALSNGWREAAPGRPPLGADAGAGAAVDVLVGVVGDQPLVAEGPHLSMIGRSAAPFGVSAYSTRGGDSG